MLKPFLYPYKLGSGSIANLKEAAGFKVIKLENSKFKPTPDKLVVNWGSSNMPNFENCIVLNDPKAVQTASDKLKFFEAMKDKVQIPEFTTDSKEAMQWLQDGAVVVARQTLNGHSGAGIYIINEFTEWKNYNHNGFKVYTKYVRKADEFRIHVFNGAVIDMQRKAMKKGYLGQPNFKIRTHQHGFVFVREDCNPDLQVLEQALLAVEHTGLDFGAVDVVWNNYYKKAYVLEINTAPGLEGQTVSTYMKAIEEFSSQPKKRKASIQWVTKAYSDPMFDVNPAAEVGIAGEF